MLAYIVVRFNQKIIKVFLFSNIKYIEKKIEQPCNCISNSWNDQEWRNSDSFSTTGDLHIAAAIDIPYSISDEKLKRWIGWSLIYLFSGFSRTKWSGIISKKLFFFIKQRFHELFIRENFAPLCSVSGAESSGYWRNHYKNIRPKYTLQSTAPNCANIRSCYNMYFPKHSLKIGTANAICWKSLGLFGD